MAMTTRNHALSPDTCDLRLFTTCEGAMARMGHDLTLGVDWSGMLEVGAEPAACTLRIEADLTTLRVLDSHGGAKSATEKDHRQILENAAKALDTRNHPTLTFTSTAISGTWDAGRVEGQLALHGARQPQAFDVRADGASHVLTGTIRQTAYGIKPFSTMMGALKLADAVTVEARVTL